MSVLLDGAIRHVDVFTSIILNNHNHNLQMIYKLDSLPHKEIPFNHFQIKITLIFTVFEIDLSLWRHLTANFFEK